MNTLIRFETTHNGHIRTCDDGDICLYEEAQLIIDRLRQRVELLEKMIRQASEALEDPILCEDTIWLNNNTTMKEAFDWILKPTPESRGERPLLEIPA